MRKSLKKLVTFLMVMGYAAGASTFSHMLTMNHPATNNNMDHTTSAIGNENANKKCIQVCINIEKGKTSSLLDHTSVKTVTYPQIIFPISPIEEIHTTFFSHHIITNGPPGEFAFSDLHLVSIAATVLLI